MKAKELKNKVYFIELNDGKHEVSFNMNTLCELEEIYGDIDTALKSFQKKPIKSLRSFICAILRSEKEELEFITEKEAGAMIPMSGMEKIAETIGKAIEESMPKPDVSIKEKEKENGDESPNV